MKVRRGNKGELLVSITEPAKKIRWHPGDRLTWTTIDGKLVIVNMDRDGVR